MSEGCLLYPVKDFLEKFSQEKKFSLPMNSREANSKYAGTLRMEGP